MFGVSNGNCYGIGATVALGANYTYMIVLVVTY